METIREGDLKENLLEGLPGFSYTQESFRVFAAESKGGEERYSKGRELSSQ